MKQLRSLKLAAWFSSLMFIVLIGCSQSPEFNISHNQDFNKEWNFFQQAMDPQQLMGSLQDSHLNLFRGKGLIIVRSSGQTGEIQVTISHENPGVELISIKTI